MKVLPKGSVSANTLDEAFEAWAIATMQRLKDMEAQQDIIYSEVKRLIGEAVPKEDPIAACANQPVVLQSAMLPSPTEGALGATGGLAHPASTDQREGIEILETQADPVSPLVPRTRRVKLRIINNPIVKREQTVGSEHQNFTFVI